MTKSNTAKRLKLDQHEGLKLMLIDKSHKYNFPFEVQKKMGPDWRAIAYFRTKDQAQLFMWALRHVQWELSEDE